VKTAQNIKIGRAKSMVLMNFTYRATLNFNAHIHAIRLIISCCQPELVERESKYDHQAFGKLRLATKLNFFNKWVTFGTYY
jgi:NADH:ubiquinone oxidoreductase subunit B-like Fe-S oxidoreductase